MNGVERLLSTFGMDPAAITGQMEQAKQKLEGAMFHFDGKLDAILANQTKIISQNERIIALLSAGEPGTETASPTAVFLLEETEKLTNGKLQPE